MAGGEVITRAKYKASVKDPGAAGVLKMVSDLANLGKLVFVPNNPNSATKLDVTFKSIKGYKNIKEGSNKPPWLNLSNEGGSYIFEFDSYSDLHVCRVFVGKALGRSGDTPAVISGRSDVILPDERISTTEMELRIKLLREDRELQTLHKQLVIDGILTEAEFWATRKKLLEKESGKKSRQLVYCAIFIKMVTRLKDAISQIYPQLEEIKKSVPAKHKQHVSVLVRQMHQALDAAFQHYEADMQK